VTGAVLTAFEYQHPGEIIFGNGRIRDIGAVVRRYGRRCLLVSGPKDGALRNLYPVIGDLLNAAELPWDHFDGVTPNPTVSLISRGAEVARNFRADVILGVGGGSSLDAAKAVAVEASHEGTSWDYLFFKRKPTSATLPVIAVGTTSGSGSPVTQVAVVTNSRNRDKSALYDERLIPRAAIIDPQLTLSLPPRVTAATGFDVLCHAFESTLNPRSSAMTELFAWEAIRRVVRDLPMTIQHGGNIHARSSMAWADILAGLAICRAGVVLPHGIAMAVGGRFPNAPHGVALAAIYRACLEFTWLSAVSKFAILARTLDSTLEKASDAEAAAACPDLIQKFLVRIDLNVSLKSLGISENELPALAQQSFALPDYANNPKVPAPEDVQKVLARSF
jgi:alcohol dehydrogenase class IV